MFESVRGQDVATGTLSRALASGQIHHAYRFVGPNGVGKEKTAFALAQYLICPQSRDPDHGDAVARVVHRIHTLSDSPPQVPLHPDLVLVQRALYSPQLLGTTSTEATGIGVDQIRKVVLTRAGYPPHEGSRVVFIIRDAEELTTSAANALLKTLEEPPPYVNFILLTSQPNRLLDTIRSRTLAVRFGPLPENDIVELLAERGLPTQAAELAEGSMDRALEQADEERAHARKDFVQRALRAIEQPSPAAALDLCTAHAKDRRELGELLSVLAHHFSIAWRSATPEHPAKAQLAAQSYELLLESQKAIERNAQPTLLLEATLLRLRRLRRTHASNAR